ncbi:MAG: hypothetical protein AAGB22_13880, partial [Bacteroidota bacterium]
MTDTQNMRARQLRIIFAIQIALLVLLGLLYMLVTLLPEGREIGILWFGVVMGALGASISLMRRLQQNRTASALDLGDKPLFTVLMPILYGTLMAGIAYLLFLSGILAAPERGNVGALISTPLFPNFEVHGGAASGGSILKAFEATRVSTVADAAKMLIWCFLAG